MILFLNMPHPTTRASRWRSPQMYFVFKQHLKVCKATTIENRVACKKTMKPCFSFSSPFPQFFIFLWQNTCQSNFVFAWGRENRFGKSAGQGKRNKSYVTESQREKERQKKWQNGDTPQETERAKQKEKVHSTWFLLLLLLTRVYLHS